MISVGDLFLALRADSRPLKGDLDGAQGQVTSWAGNLGGKISGLLGGAVLAGVGAATAAVVGIGTAAFTAASDFDAATKKMQSSLGLTDTAAAGFKETMQNIFANNFGNDIEDVADSLTKVEAAFGRIGGTESYEELQFATEAALALRDTFDVEVNESTEAAIELMDKFGLTANQAFGFITSGYQQGLNASDDFLDSITEYSTQFSNGGADATQFFSLLQSGLQAGALGTDKAADAFKEFRIRIGDGSTLTAQGLQLLGLNADKVLGDLARGSITSADAFELVLEKLKSIEDPNLRLQAGVALLGTQFEDLGDSAVAGLSLASFAVTDFEDDVAKLNKQYETIPAFFEGLRRRALVAITPIGEALLSVANEALPYIGEAFDTLEARIEQFIANSSFEWSPEFKQIKLGDLFEFISTDALTYVNLGEYVSFVYNKESGATDIKIGDLFSLSTSEDGTQINLADYLTFIYDNESGAVALKVGDLLTVVSDDGGTFINLADFVKFSYDNETGVIELNVGDLLTIVNDEDGTEFNLADYVEIVYRPGERVKLKVSEIVEIDNTEETSSFKLDLTSLLAFAFPVTTKQLFDLTAPPEVAPTGLRAFFTWLSGDEVTKTTQSDLFDLSTPEKPAAAKLADFFDWISGSDEQVVKLTFGDFFDFSADTAAGTARIKLGDLFEFVTADGSTKYDIFGGLFTYDPSTITKVGADAFIDTETPVTLQFNPPDWLTGLTWPEFVMPTWLTDLTLPEFVMPTWITDLMGFTFPDLGEATRATLDAIVAWIWPDAPATISDLLEWAWPEFVGSLATMVSGILKFEWPDFGGNLSALINGIIKFQWPEMKTPLWITELVKITTSVPQWVTDILNWDFPTLPDLNPFNNDDPTPPVEETVINSSLRGYSSVSSANGPTPIYISFYDTVVNNGQDIEEFAYRVANRLAYGV